MLKNNALDEYGDVGLCGDASYSNDDICLIVEDSKVVSVVGKMQACAMYVDEELGSWFSLHIIYLLYWSFNIKFNLLQTAYLYGLIESEALGAI